MKNAKEAACTEEGYTGDKVCKEPIAPNKIAADSLQTGDNSNTALWIALLFVSGAGVFGVAVYSRKGKYV